MAFGNITICYSLPQANVSGREWLSPAERLLHEVHGAPILSVSSRTEPGSNTKQRPCRAHVSYFPVPITAPRRNPPGPRCGAVLNNPPSKCGGPCWLGARAGRLSTPAAEFATSAHGTCAWGGEAAGFPRCRLDSELLCQRGPGKLKVC